MKTWEEYYSDRVNNEDYLNNFASKYNTFLKMILIAIMTFKDKVVFREEGCGIGMISKCLCLIRPDIMKSHVKKIEFRDVNAYMLLLCNKNNQHVTDIPTDYHVNDILIKPEYEPGTFLVTHGVLEHFSDKDLEKIASHFDHENGNCHFHYVPTNLYETKSFGDERLLPMDYWGRMFEPDLSVLANGLKDLYFAKHVAKH